MKLCAVGAQNVAQLQNHEPIAPILPYSEWQCAPKHVSQCFLITAQRQGQVLRIERDCCLRSAKVYRPAIHQPVNCGVPWRLERKVDLMQGNARIDRPTSI